MNDFGRLGVGIVLLALAIFLSYSLDGGAGPDETGSPVNGQAIADDAVPPQWQAPDDANGVPAIPAGDIVRPSFDPAPSPREMFGSPNGPGEFAPPGTLATDLPRLDDQYRALVPFRVTASGPRDNSLVPIQPRPGFTRPIPFSPVVHTIRPGDSLQSISSEYYGTADRYLEIYLANKHLLANPARLPEGVQIRIPDLPATTPDGGQR